MPARLPSVVELGIQLLRLELRLREVIKIDVAERVGAARTPASCNPTTDCGGPGMAATTAPPRRLVRPRRDVIRSLRTIGLGIPLGRDVGPLRRQTGFRRHPFSSAEGAAASGSPRVDTGDPNVTVIPPTLPSSLPLGAVADFVRGLGVICRRVPLGGNVGALRRKAVRGQPAFGAGIAVHAHLDSRMPSMPCRAAPMGHPVRLWQDSFGIKIVALPIPIGKQLWVQARKGGLQSCDASGAAWTAIAGCPGPDRHAPIVPASPTSPVCGVVTVGPELGRAQCAVGLFIPVQSCLSRPVCERAPGRWPRQVLYHLGKEYFSDQLPGVRIAPQNRCWTVVPRVVAESRKLVREPAHELLVTLFVREGDVLGISRRQSVIP